MRVLVKWRPPMRLRDYLENADDGELPPELRTLKEFMRHFPDIDPERVSRNFAEEALMGIRLGVEKKLISRYLLSETRDTPKWDSIKGNQARLAKFRELGLDKYLTRGKELTVECEGRRYPAKIYGVTEPGHPFDIDYYVDSLAPPYAPPQLAFSIYDACPNAEQAIEALKNQICQAVMNEGHDLRGLVEEFLRVVEAKRGGFFTLIFRGLVVGLPEVKEHVSTIEYNCQICRRLHRSWIYIREEC
ncbi:MAG: hypothetical protein NZ938_00355 [Aigarchaeota archaeon]|nr:hypothetical protein [Candidatus Calditenuaceae archaeon]